MLLVPDFPDPDVEILSAEYLFAIVTEPVQTPATKEEVLVGLIVPERSVRVFELV